MNKYLNRKSTLLLTTLLIAVFTFFLGSCQNLFEKESPAKAPVYIISGKLGLQGAVPENFIATQKVNSRTATISQNFSNIDYTITATSSQGNVITTKISSTTANPNFSIGLQKGNWEIKVTGITTVNSKPVKLIGQTSIQVVSDIPDIFIPVSPEMTGAGKGAIYQLKFVNTFPSEDINLEINFVDLNKKYNEQVPRQNSFLFTVNSFYSGSHRVHFTATKGDKTYEFDEIINIFDNLSTNTWVNNGTTPYFSPDPEDSSKLCVNFTNKLFESTIPLKKYYVHGDGGVLTTKDDTKPLGSLANPYDAAGFQSLINNITSSTNLEQVTIYIDGDVKDPNNNINRTIEYDELNHYFHGESDENTNNGAFIYINSSSNTINLLIKGLGLAAAGDKINANRTDESASSMVIHSHGTSTARINLTLDNVTITGGRFNYALDDCQENVAGILLNYTNLTILNNTVFEDNVTVKNPSISNPVFAHDILVSNNSTLKIYGGNFNDGNTDSFDANDSELIEDSSILIADTSYNTSFYIKGNPNLSDNSFIYLNDVPIKLAGTINSESLIKIVTTIDSQNKLLEDADEDTYTNLILENFEKFSLPNNIKVLSNGAITKNYIEKLYVLGTGSYSDGKKAYWSEGMISGITYSSSTNEYFISGNDSNTGLSSNSPLATLKKAMEQASTNNNDYTIYVAGLLEESEIISDTRYMSNKKIHIKAWNPIVPDADHPPIIRQTESSCSLLNIGQNDFIFSEITFDGGNENPDFKYSLSDGALLSIMEDNSNVIFTDCTIKNFTIQGIGEEKPIGIISNKTGTENSNIQITNCTFRNIITENGKGSAININGANKLTIYNSNFIENNSYDGGAIYVDNDTDVLIKNCIFDGNNCELYGGSIYISNAKLLLENTEIKNSIKFKRGGGLCCTNNSDVTIKQCKFTNNKYSSYDYAGGAIVNEKNSKLTIYGGTIFSQNSTFYGGAVYNTGNLYLYGEPSNTIVFEKNDAQYGGGLYLGLGSYFYISNVLFKENSVQNRGGAIYINFQLITSIFNNVSFENNKNNNTENNIYYTYPTPEQIYDISTGQIIYSAQ